MTWAEWVESEYNTNGWYKKYYEQAGNELITDSSSEFCIGDVKLEDIITSKNYNSEPAPREP